MGQDVWRQQQVNLTIDINLLNEEYKNNGFDYFVEFLLISLSDN